MFAFNPKCFKTRDILFCLFASLEKPVHAKSVSFAPVLLTCLDWLLFSSMDDGLLKKQQQQNQKIKPLTLPITTITQAISVYNDLKLCNRDRTPNDLLEFCYVPEGQDLGGIWLYQFGSREKSHFRTFPVLTDSNMQRTKLDNRLWSRIYPSDLTSRLPKIVHTSLFLVFWYSLVVNLIDVYAMTML